MEHDFDVAERCVERHGIGEGGGADVEAEGVAERFELPRVAPAEEGPEPRGERGIDDEPPGISARPVDEDPGARRATAGGARAALCYGRARPMTRYVGESRFDGCVAFATCPRAALATLLPPDVEPVGAGSGEMHPVVFVFGEQTEGAFLFGGFSFPMGIRYHEAAIIVPAVCRRGDGRLHNFIPRMYASYFPAVWNGNTHYGYGKELAALGWHDRTFVVAGDGDRPRLAASVDGAGPWAPAAGTPAGLDRVRALGGAPVLGRRGDGVFVASTFDWDFADADVRMVRTDVTTDVLGRCPSAAAEAFEIRGMRWRVSWPAACPSTDAPDHRRRRSSPNARIRP